LHSSCPVCVSLRRATPAAKWTHKDCGGKMLVSNLAHYKCDKCGQTSHVVNWKYRCPSHGPGFENEMEYSFMGHINRDIELIIQGNINRDIEFIIQKRDGLKWMQDFITEYRKDDWKK